MSKTVTIPNTPKPYAVVINGKKYHYINGATVSVPDEVAALIESNGNLKPKEEEMASKGAILTKAEDKQNAGKWKELTEAIGEGIGVDENGKLGVKLGKGLGFDANGNIFNAYPYVERITLDAEETYIFDFDEFTASYDTFFLDGDFAMDIVVTVDGSIAATFVGSYRFYLRNAATDIKFAALLGAKLSANWTMMQTADGHDLSDYIDGDSILAVELFFDGAGHIYPIILSGSIATE